jgi:hypothetical protein
MFPLQTCLSNSNSGSLMLSNVAVISVAGPQCILSIVFLVGAIREYLPVATRLSHRTNGIGAGREWFPSAFWGISQPLTIRKPHCKQFDLVGGTHQVGQGGSAVPIERCFGGDILLGLCSTLVSEVLPWPML